MFRKAKQAKRSTRERQEEEEASNLFVVASNAAIERLPRTADRSSAFGVAGGGAYGVFSLRFGNVAVAETLYAHYWLHIYSTRVSFTQLFT